jgi:hypothetical protein
VKEDELFEVPTGIVSGARLGGVTIPSFSFTNAKA